jgi:hypothetical protein
MNLRAITEVTQPSVEPMSLAEMKLFCSIDNTDEDTLIAAIITAARTTIERQTGLVLVQHQFKLTMPSWFSGNWDDRGMTPYGVGMPYPAALANFFPSQRRGESNRIYLERSPLLTIDTVQYYDSTETLQTLLPTGNWRTLTHCRPGALELRADAQWPDVYDRSDAVQITFTSGFGAASSNVPGDLLALMRLFCKHYYDNRDSFIVGGGVADIPMTLKMLLDANRVGGFVA